MSTTRAEARPRCSHYGAIGDRLLEAAAAVLARGERLTYRALAVGPGDTPQMAYHRVRRLAAAGRWPHPRLPEHAGGRRGGPPGPGADRERRVLEAAAAVSAADPAGRVAVAALVAASGLDPGHVRLAVKRLRDRHLWPYLGRPVTAAAPGADEPAAVARRKADRDREILAGMGDGRREVDDPATHAAAAPRSGRRHAPREPGLRRVCEGYLREWWAIVGAGGRITP